MSLDNCGSALAAIGKGFSTSSALLSSLTVFSAVLYRLKSEYLMDWAKGSNSVSILQPMSLAFLLVGKSID